MPDCHHRAVFFHFQVAHGQEQRKLVEASLEKRLLDHLKITEVPLPEPESEEEEVQLPEITPEMEQVVQSAYGSRSTLVDKFNIAISGKDVQTLRGTDARENNKSYGLQLRPWAPTWQRRYIVGRYSTVNERNDESLKNFYDYYCARSEQDRITQTLVMAGYI